MSGACGIAHRPSPAACSIEAPVKNRNGHPRWWCSTHGCQAWGSHGERLDQCAGRQQKAPANVLVIDPSEYAGGIGVWGAVNPVYSWGMPPPDRPGIHVHARHEPSGPKEIDQTYDEVVFITAEGSWRLTASMAVAFMVSTVLGLPVKALRCRHCNELHLDQFEFAVKPHVKHQCNICGRHFFDGTTRGIANPVADLRRLLQPGERSGPEPSSDSLDLVQREISGLAIWGSNEAILWTAHQPEREGIHVHTIDMDGREATDDTYDQVKIDGVLLDPAQTRLLMVQQTLPFLYDRVQALVSQACGAALFDRGVASTQPEAHHRCHICGEEVRPTIGNRKVVSNPLVAVLGDLRGKERGKRRHCAA